MFRRLSNTVLSLMNCWIKWSWLTMLPIAFVVSYFLSFGPVWWLTMNGYLPGHTLYQAVDTFYVPLGWLHENNEACRFLIDGYVDLWVPITIFSTPFPRGI